MFDVAQQAQARCVSQYVEIFKGFTMFQSIHVSLGYSVIKMNSAGPLDLSKKNTPNF